MSGPAKARIRVALIALAALYLELSFGPNLRIGGVAPDLLTLVTIAAALAAGPEHGAFCGFGCGLLTDLYLQDTPFGLSALCLCLIGYLVGTFRAASPTDSRLIIPPVTLVATALSAALFLALAGLFSNGAITREGWSWLIRVVVIESIYAAVLSLPAYWLLRWAARSSAGAVALGPAVAR